MKTSKQNKIIVILLLGNLVGISLAYCGDHFNMIVDTNSSQINYNQYNSQLSQITPISLADLWRSESSRKKITPRSLIDSPLFPLPRTIENSTITFIGSGKEVELIKNLRGSPILLGHGYSPELSRDSSSLAYIGFEKDPSGSGSISSLRVLDLKTNIISSITIESSCRVWEIKWSKRGTYLALRLRTSSAEDGFSCWVLKSNNLEKIYDFQRCFDIRWIGDSKLMTLPISLFKNSKKHPNSNLTHGINLVDIGSGRVKKIRRAKWNVNYHFLTSGISPVVTVSEVRNWEDWSKNIYRNSYPIVVEVEGRIRIIKAKPGIGYEGYRSLEKDLDIKNSTYYLSDYSDHPLSSHWKLFLVGRVARTENEDETIICIADLDDPIRTIRSIAKGTAPRW